MRLSEIDFSRYIQGRYLFYSSSFNCYCFLGAAASAAGYDVWAGGVKKDGEVLRDGRVLGIFEEFQDLTPQQRERAFVLIVELNDTEKLTFNQIKDRIPSIVQEVSREAL